MIHRALPEQQHQSTGEGLEVVVLVDVAFIVELDVSKHLEGVRGEQRTVRWLGHPFHIWNAYAFLNVHKQFTDNSNLLIGSTTD